MGNVSRILSKSPIHPVGVHVAFNWVVVSGSGGPDALDPSRDLRTGLSDAGDGGQDQIPKEQWGAVWPGRD